MSALKRLGLGVVLSLAYAGAAQAQSSPTPQTPVLSVTPNVNVLPGIQDPYTGDAFKQRQTESVIAVSTRNPDHLMVAANDYRAVDIADDQGVGNVVRKVAHAFKGTALRLLALATGRRPFEVDGDEAAERKLMAGSEAWVGMYFSNDRGRTWSGALMPGFPQDTSVVGRSTPAFGRLAASDPVLAPAPGGRFYLGAMAFDRGGLSKIVVSRFTDLNNSENGNNFHFDLMSTVDLGSKDGRKFLDKPAIAADIARFSSDPAACGPVYIAWTVFDEKEKDALERSKILFSSSYDCGKTWTEERKVSHRAELTQGVALAIDPKDGTVFVVYRSFSDNKIYVTSSKFLGFFFGPAYVLSGPTPIVPFDQPTLGAPDYAFRTNGFPTATVDRDGNLFVAWQERITADGNPRIMLTSSADDGKTWKPKQALGCTNQANGVVLCPSAGPQFMPSLTYSRGKLMLLYYEALGDVSYVPSLKASYITGLTRELNVNVAQIDPSTRAVVTAATLTHYGTIYDRTTSSWRIPETAPGYPATNRPNLPMYAGGTMPFIGDYISIAPSAPFVPATSADVAATAKEKEKTWPLGRYRQGKGKEAEGKGKEADHETDRWPRWPLPTPYWRWATEPTDGPSATFHAVWNDNRDTVFPITPKGGAVNSSPIPLIDGDWTKYSPPGTGQASCINPGSRDANVYSAEISPKLVVGSPVTFKQLGVQRAFVMYVQNRMPSTQYYRLTIADNPPAFVGSFLQRSAKKSLDAAIFAFSSITKTVYVTAANPSDRTPMVVNVQQIDASGLLVPGGEAGTVVFNGDASNPELSNPELSNTEKRNPELSNPELSNPELSNKLLPTPELSNKPPLAPELSNVSISNSPLSDPNAPKNDQITDLTWHVTNNGTTAAAYASIIKLANADRYKAYRKQLIIYKTSKTPSGCPVGEIPIDHLISIIENPELSNPELSNDPLATPELSNPELSNATFFVAPADLAAKGTAKQTQPGAGTLTLAAYAPTAAAPDLTFGGPSQRVVSITLRIYGNQAPITDPSLPPPPPPPGPPPPINTDTDAQIAVTAQAANVTVQNGTTVIDPAPASDSHAPDLVISAAPAVSPLTVGTGDTVTLQPFTTTNAGDQNAIAGFRYNFYLSMDNQIDASTASDTTITATTDLRLSCGAGPCNRIVGTPLAIGASFTPAAAETVRIPQGLAPGTYYIGVFVDDTAIPSIPEVTVNNFSVQAITVLPGGNFVTTPPSALATKITAGQSTQVSFTVSNSSPGSDGLAASTAAVLLSTDATASANDTRLTTAAIPALGPLGTSPQTLSVTIPSGTAPGNYFLIVQADQPGVVPEFSEADNTAAIPFVVNAPPVAVNDVATVNEDGSVTVNVLANDSNPDGDVLTVVVTSQAVHGTAVVNPNKTITYTPLPDYNGPDSFGYTIDDGFGGSSTATVSVTVNSVNDVPSFTKGANRSHLRNAGAQTVANWATAISAGPANEAGQVVNFIVSNNNNALFSAQPAVSAAGTLTYTPATNAVGSATVTVQIHDNGGTANGGVDTSAPQTFIISVTAVNDAPSFTKGADQTSNEDAGLQTVTNWATNISPGPPDEAGQILNFIVSNNNNALFSTQPAISPAGTLTYAAASNATGLATVTVQLHDNGGTANGGLDTSASQQFTITITAVNDAPSFTKGGNQTVAEDSGAQTVANWATNRSAGPPDEAAQTLNFIVSNDNNALFSVQPAVSVTGTLTYTPGPNANGAATVTVQIHDSGGIASGGVDTSAAQQFTITITAVNDAPSFTKGADQTVSEDSGAQTVNGWATSISAGPPDEAGQTLNFIVSNDNNALFATQPAVSAAGTLTYTPAANKNGSATVSVQIHDNGGTANGGADMSAAQTFVITVTAVNDPPVAVNDTATTNNDVPVVIAVLANDSDVDGDALTVTNVTTPAHGTATINNDGTVTYSPAFLYFGPDAFGYTISDGHGGTASATVNVTVNQANHAPIANNDSATAVAGTPTPINVLGNDVDYDNPTGSVVASIPFLPGGLPNNFGAANETAFYNGKVYVMNSRRVGVFNPSTGAFEATIPMPVFTGANFSKVSAATGYIYFRGGPVITALNANTNTIAGQVTISGSFRSMDLDDTNKKLYVTYQVSPVQLPTGASQQCGVDVIDTNPANPTFLQVLYNASFPLNVFVHGIAVNPNTNKIYVGATNGIWQLDGATHLLTQISFSGAQQVAVNSAANLVFGHGVFGLPNGTQGIVVIDPKNGNSSTSVTLPGLVQLILAPNKPHIAVNTTSGRVYVRSLNNILGSNGSIYVVDGSRSGGNNSSTPCVCTLGTTIPTGSSDESNDDIVIDEGVNSGAGVTVASVIDGLRVHVIDGATNAVISTLTARQDVADLSIDPATHTAYGVGFFSWLNKISFSGTPALTEIPIGAESEGIAVDTGLHKAYVGKTGDNGASVLILNKNGLAGTLSLPTSSLPTSSGRYSFIGVNSTTHQAFIVNTDSNSTGTDSSSFEAEVDTTNDTVLGSGNDSPVAGLGVSEATNKVYIGTFSQPSGGSTPIPGKITIFNPATNVETTANTSAFDANASFFRTFVTLKNGTTDKTYFLVTGSSLGTGGVLDNSTNIATPLPTSLGTIAQIAVHSAVNRVYVGNTLGQFFVLDAANNNILQTMSIGARSPVVGLQSYVAVDEGNGHVYVADFNKNGVTVLDANNNYALIGGFGTGAGPTSVAVNPVSHRVYVGSALDSRLTFFDGTALAAIGTLQLPFPANFMAVDPGELRLYTSNGFADMPGALVIADTGSNAALTVASVTTPSQGTASIFTPGNTAVIYTGAAAGQATFNYTISDGSLTSQPATVTVNVTAPLSITTSSLPAGSVGTLYDLTVAASGGTAPYLFTIVQGALPSGFTMSTSGRILGTPNFGGTFTFTVQVIDATAFGTFFQSSTVATKQFTVVIGPFAIMTASLPTATLNQSYSATIAAGGSSATPFTFSLANNSPNQMPPGLTLNSNGTITGTPTQATCSSVPLIVQAVDSTSPTPQVATQSITMFFSGPIKITTTALNAVTLESFQPGISTNGCGGSNRTWSLPGTTGQTTNQSGQTVLYGGVLPIGVGFNSSNGSFVNMASLNIPAAGITNGPRQNGSFPITIGVTDSSGSDSKNLTLNVHGVDQQPGSGTATTIGTINGVNTRVAQTFTAAQADTLTAVSFAGIAANGFAISCPMTVTIEGVATGTGAPDDSNVFRTASAILTGPNQTIAISPGVSFAANAQFAVVVAASSNTTCLMIDAAVADLYTGGAAYTSTSANTWFRSSPADYQVTVMYANPSNNLTISGPANVVFGGTTRVAQTVTVGASGTLTAVRFPNLSAITPATSCPVTVQIEGVLATSGAPDDTQLFGAPASLTVTGTNQLFVLPTPLVFAPDSRFAIVLSSTGQCQITNSQVNDNYVSGAAYINTGGGWSQPTAGTFAAADFPVNTLIQNPSLLYLARQRGTVRTVALSSTKVLIMGTDGTAEVYDFSTGVSTPTGSMTASRSDFAATLLACPSTAPGCAWGGKVLVTGGFFTGSSPTNYLNTTELFDPAGMPTLPATGVGTWTASSTMNNARSQHTATRLACATPGCAWEGKVLLSGGNNSSGSLAAADLYDPSNGNVTAVSGGMVRARNRHQATVLANSNVLMTGGFGSGSTANSSEIYDPSAGATGSFAATGNMVTPRGDHSAILLSSGNVLVAGGQTTSGTTVQLSAAEIYSVSGGTFSATGSLLNPRQRFQLAMLGNGDVVAMGGVRNTSFTGPPWAATDRFASGTWSGAPSLLVTRDDQGVWPLTNGRIAVISGASGSGGSRQAGQTIELFDPGTGSGTGTPTIANPNLPDGHVGQNPQYSAPLSGTGGTPGYSFGLVGSAPLPPGLSVVGNAISGNPTAPGTYYFMIRITDSAVPTPHFSDQTLRIRIDALDITTTSLVTAYVGKPYLNNGQPVVLSATGVGGKTWSIISGTLPGGLALCDATPPCANPGLISGTPTGTGTFNFTVKATDSVGQTATAALSIQVSNPLTITTTSLGDGIVMNNYGGCVNWSNGSGTVTLTLSGSLPPEAYGGFLAFQNGGVGNGCFDTSAGHQTTQTGSFTFTVTATDASVPQQTDSKIYTVQIHAQDQQVFSQPSTAINLDPTRRVAQVFASSTPFGLSGVQLVNLSSCTTGMTITSQIRPVIGSPARPDETGQPLAQSSVQVGNNGGFNTLLPLGPVAMPQHARFAVVLSFSGGSVSCQGTNWPTADVYPKGEGWVDDGGGWQLLTTLGRPDVPMLTLMQPNGLSFLTSFRSEHRSVGLSNGKVLLVGSNSANSSQPSADAFTADLYDPVGQTVQSIGNMTTARYEPSATLMPNGKVLVIGGRQGPGATVVLTSMDLFDPSANNGAGAFDPNFVANLNVGRSGHTATQLGNGKVLVTGGWTVDVNGNFIALQSAELYDPGANSVSAPFNMLSARSEHTATLLACPTGNPGCSWGGKVLIAGGYSSGVPGPSAEIYDPSSGASSAAFTATGNAMPVFMSEHTATLLTAGTHAGQVLLIGSQSYPTLAASTTFFDPAGNSGAGAFSAVASSPSLVTPRRNQGATLLGDGRVVVTGGEDRPTSDNKALSDVETFNPGVNQFSRTNDLKVERSRHTADLLTTGPNAGKIFIAGGSSTGQAGRNAELLDPNSTPLLITTTSLPDGQTSPAAFTSTALAASGGSGNYAFAKVWGELPPGLTLSNGVISGSPSQRGAYSFVIQVTDTLTQATATKAFTIVIDKLSITTTSPLPAGTVGSPYGGVNGYQLSANGAGMTWFVECCTQNFPPGLSLNSSGVLSGTPTTVGTYNITVKVLDNSGQYAFKSFSLTVQ